MVLWSVENARALGADSILLVVGEGADDVRSTVGDGVEYAVQKERLGTGHALLQARDALLDRADVVLVLYGDMPTLRRETMQAMLALHDRCRPAVTMLTVMADDSMGFGRVVRDDAGRVTAIVEEAVATPEILSIRELNCGVYCFDAEWLWQRLLDVPLTLPKNEYYLTDMVGLAVADGRAVEVVTVADVAEVQGVNTRVHLAESERILRDRINERMMLDGVTMIDPATTYIDATVRVGRDSVIYPNTMLRGDTAIGQNCEIGPNSVIVDSRIGDGCRIMASVLEEAVMDDGAEIGPYGHLRKGAHLGAGVHMGNFGEVKNSYLAPGTKMGHFSYVGDSEIEENVNIGAGTVTCNYDGRNKHRTAIGAGAFIGSGTMLVAPVTVGKGARTGAGSVLTHDLPDHTLAYGVPARPIRRLDDDEEAHDQA
jgi:bifunctional UDP-N-acetylglucosamine pyrophosphorylase/glucosamine-1-phosphate N-acetyltransferase